MLFRIPRLKLIQKLIISFSISAVCMIGALMYTVSGLGAMHRSEVEIARTDLAAANLTITLREVLLAQQRYAGRYLILRNPEFSELYYRNGEKFLSGLTELKRIYPGTDLNQLEKNYRAYEEQNRRLFAGSTIDESAMKKSVEQVENTLEHIRSQQRHELELKLKASDERETTTVSWALGLAFSGVFVAFMVTGLLIYSFSTSINKLQKATHRIAAGEFDYDPHIATGDEIGALAQDFMRMAARLKELEQISLDASPLTRLPGNIAIERSINRRLRDGASFAMCYLDVDNFKSYNDHYGYIKASEVLKQTGEVIYDAVKRQSDPDAFVGHIGGDDFVVIIDAKRVKSTCQEIIARFDAMVPSFYSAEDLAAGAIEGVDRYGVPRSFPLISLSIAALTCQPGSYATAAEIATAAAGLKDRVKESSGSNYIIVRETGIIET